MCLAAQPCMTLANPWTQACQAPHFMGFCSKEYWNVLSFPSSGLNTHILYRNKYI